jgi:hypothetical protein
MDGGTEEQRHLCVFDGNECAQEKLLMACRLTVKLYSNEEGGGTEGGRHKGDGGTEG